MKTQHDYWQESHDLVMAEMKLDPAYGAVPPTHTPANTITCLAGGEEMLRVGPDGFWVRGVKVEQNDQEAKIVYNAMKEFLTWTQLNRP
jgi:hypothetical protein